MTRKSFYALTLATTTAIVAGLTLPAVAHDWDGKRPEGPRHERMMMGEGHGKMGGMMMRHGMMGGGMMGHGPMRQMMQQFDANNDGDVTPDELRTGLTAKLKEFDADGNGTLSLDEFEALHTAMMREHTVDKFQFLDDDGDGQVTADEIAKPANMMEQRQKMRQKWQEQHQKRRGMGRMMQDDGDNN